MSSQPARPRAGPSRHVYDVIVAGGQLGGAIAGALLAKRGYGVLLVEHDGMGHGYEHDGYVLPYSPFIAPPPKAMSTFDDVLVELGLNTTVQRALKPHAPDLQLVMPGHRVDLHHDEPRRLAELKREFPKDSATIHAAITAAASQHESSDAFFKEAPNLSPDGFFEGMGLKRQIGRHLSLGQAPALSGDAPAMKLLSALRPFLSYVDDPDEPLARARPVSQVLMAPNRYPGGREGLRELFTKKMTDFGGELLSRENSDAAVVEELSFDGSKIAGIKVVHNETVYRAATVIAATDAGALRRLVTDKKKQRGLAETLDLVTTKRFLYALNWVLPARAVPRGMGDLLMIQPYDDELGPMLVQLAATRRVGEKSEDDQLRTLCAGVFVASSARDLGEPHLHQLSARIVAELDRLMPFSKDSLILQSAPYLDAGGVRGSRLLPHPLYQIDAERYLGITGLPQRTSVKNLFLASREVLPGLGLEGEVLAGVRAAKLVGELLKKNDPLKR